VGTVAHEVFPVGNDQRLRMNSTPENVSQELRLDQRVVLQASVLIVALCGIVYELIIATIASYLVGDSVYQFSLTIGLFMFAMGMGSLVTAKFRQNLISRFVVNEVLIAIVGGLSSIILFTVFPWTVLFYPVMYSLILLIGFLVGLEIPLLIRVMSDTSGFRESVANVLALDYFGALIGSVAFPLLLLPFLGLFRASFCIGLLNGFIAILNIYVFWDRIQRPIFWLTTTIFTLVLLMFAMVYASFIARFAEGQLYSDQIVFSRQTPYQHVVLTKSERSSEHRLYVDGHLQFAERDEYRYHESLVHPVMSLPGPKKRVLILGGGDGLAAREVLKYAEVEKIDLVDIDPEIVRLCRSFPAIKQLNESSLDSQKLEVHNQDAFRFLRDSLATTTVGQSNSSSANNGYDRVIIDLPDPHNEALCKLYSVEFYKLVRQNLRAGGCFVTQSASPWVTREAYWSVAKTIEAAELETYSYHITVPNFGVWGFHLATDKIGTPDFRIQAETRYLTDEIMKHATIFGKDESRENGVVNSIFEPKLYLIYHRGLKE
jgi:spermidine synthase